MSRPNDPNRFNEERATYVLRNAAQEVPDLERGIKRIKDVVRTLSTRPGVYRMVDGRGDVLYVGKARILRNRVTSYTHVAGLSTRLKRMVAQTHDLEIVTTNSEAEALLLEAQLIKRFRPPYNVLLRDDKSFPFILLRGDHAFPRIQKHRGARKVKGRYYGPFAGAESVSQTLNALQKTFLLRSCSDSFFANRSRPCLLYQIRRCSAPCVGRISEEDYSELVAEAQNFLEGRSIAVQKKLGAAMDRAADALDYEQAAVYRDRLKSLTFIQGSQAVNAKELGDADIFAMAAQAGLMCIVGFFIRSGQNWGHRSFFPRNTADISREDVLARFIMQFYAALPPPPLILVDREPLGAELVAEALRVLAKRKVEIKVAQRGQRRLLLDQAARNANEELERHLAKATTQAKLGEEIATIFKLPSPPQRIEIYDNSHTQGTNAIGAMVVAGPDGWIKGAYRKFNIKREDTVAGDDFAMMREVFQRRFERAQREDSNRKGEWPDLVLIDGGKGQVSAVAAVLAALGIDDLPYIGVAKGSDRNAGREIFHLANGRELTLPPNSAALFYIQRLRDEAHRFAIGAHRKKRAKAMKSSSLDVIAGIGPARKKALLMHFGTARAVRDASIEDLQRTPGVSLVVAQTIYDFYHA